MTASTQIILDPSASHGKNGRAWQSCQRECLRQLAPAEVTIAETAPEAEEIARVSAHQGYGKIISVGGNETAHGIVNGLMGLTEDHRKKLGLGFLSLARPTDWCRTMDFPGNITRQLEILKAGHTFPFDVGKVEFIDDSGDPATRFFLNGVRFGLTSQIKCELAGPHSGFSETIKGIADVLAEYLIRQRLKIRLEGDAGLIFEGRFALVLAMGGRYYPGLGEIAPEANPADGELDVIRLADPSGWKQALKLIRLMLPFKKGGGWSSTVRTTNLLAKSQGGTVYLEADGQHLGRLPATITSLPGSISVILPQVGARIKKPVFTPLPKLEEGGLAGFSRSID